MDTDYPFTITHILTDNGLEFTDKFVTKDKQVSGKHKFDKLCSRSEIEHRLTQPVTPKTNGILTALPMVYRPPYTWYIDPPTHGILTPLPMEY